MAENDNDSEQEYEKGLEQLRERCRVDFRHWLPQEAFEEGALERYLESFYTDDDHEFALLPRIRSLLDDTADYESAGEEAALEELSMSAHRLLQENAGGARDLAWMLIVQPALLLDSNVRSGIYLLLYPENRRHINDATRAVVREMAEASEADFLAFLNNNDSVERVIDSTEDIATCRARASELVSWFDTS